jgi:uncharacterized RmlC-like cupin family protein
MEALETSESNQSDGIVVVRPASWTMSRQRLPVGISGSTAGAKNISMNLIAIPLRARLNRICIRAMKRLFICLRAE